MKPQKFIAILEEMVEQQRAKLLAVAREYDPDLTFEDLLSPHDIPLLCNDIRFSYEDGILAGLLSARAALLAELSSNVAGLIPQGSKNQEPR